MVVESTENFLSAFLIVWINIFIWPLTQPQEKILYIKLLERTETSIMPLSGFPYLENNLMYYNHLAVA